MIERSEILALLQDAATKLLGPEAPTLTDDLELGTDSIDSLELIEVMIEVEDRVGVRFDEDEFDGVTTVGALVDILENHLRAVHV